MHKFTKALAAIGLAAVMSQSAMAENLKLGFLVKQPEEPWFQTEWKFADKAGKDLGFEVIKIAVPDGEKTLNAIDSLDALKAAGFPEKQIYQVPTKSNDIPGAFDAANSMLVQHPEVKHWLIVGMNDSTVLGGVRATEGQGFKAADIIGIGINGVDAVSELSKAQATGFYGSLLPSPDVHGYKSSEMLYNWVAKGVEPTKFTEVTDVVLITRDNFKEELEKKGLGGK